MSGGTALPPRHGWVSHLVRVGLQQESIRSLSELTKVITEATGAEGSVIWETAEAGQDEAPFQPSMLTAWFNDDIPLRLHSRLAPDPVTEEVFRSGHAAVSSDGEGSPVADKFTSALAPAATAVPFVFLDNNLGVVSLYSRRALATEVLLLLEELAELLPELCHLIRDRQTLQLLEQCSRIFREADEDSPDRPISKNELTLYLQILCEQVAVALQCVDVSLFLEDSLTTPGLCPMVASSSRQPDGQTPQQTIREYEGFTGWVLATGNPAAVPNLEQALNAPEYIKARFPGFQWKRTTIESEPDTFASIPHAKQPGACLSTLMAVPIMTGTKVKGVLRCRGATGPPYHFTPRDVSTVAPVAALIAQYWNRWLGRRSKEAETQSWKDFAQGIKSLNLMIHDELLKESPEKLGVYQEALRILHTVAPIVSASDVREVQGTNKGRFLRFAAVEGALWKSGTPEEQQERLARVFPLSQSPPRSAGDRVYQTKHRYIVRDTAQETAYSPTFPAVKWLVVAPIRVSDRIDGVLDVRGTVAPLPPDNDPQVAEIAEIIGGQLGLYLHLERTILSLHEMQDRQQRDLRSQVQAFMDLEHQLVSPLLAATMRVEQLLDGRGRFDSRTEATLRAVRGLCRKATSVAMSAGLFADLARGMSPSPRLEHIGPDELRAAVTTRAADTELLTDPRLRKQIDVNRDSLMALGKRVLRIDRSYLDQCLGNILDNAVKYCYKGTVVSVLGRESGSYFSICVRSQGIPIAQDEVEHCIKREWRGVDARSATGEGSGLGLWIVDHLMHSMRGQVRIEPDGDVTTVELRFRTQ